METEVYPGSCLCGAIRFELHGAPTDLAHCHCRMCQKAHGATFATYALVPHAAFRFTAGEERLVTYRSSDLASRTFCAQCGSSLQYLPDGHDTFGLAVAAFDRPLEPQPVREFCTESRIDWLARSDP